MNSMSTEKCKMHLLCAMALSHHTITHISMFACHAHLLLLLLLSVFGTSKMLSHSYTLCWGSLVVEAWEGSRRLGFKSQWVAMATLPTKPPITNIRLNQLVGC